MAKQLSSYLNSGYLNAANKLQKKKVKKIVAYVESYDDIFFWRSILSQYENEERVFEVMLPSKTNLNRGKKTAMMNRLGDSLGEYMIACVDADIDYLLQGATRNSRLMLDNPYVVHTYAYAIENLQCWAPSLHNVCVMATLNDRTIFDFEEYLKSYSEAVYDLFVWAMWLYRHDRFSEMPLNKLNNFITPEKVNIFNPTEALDRLRHNVNRRVAWMQSHYPEAKGKIKPLKADLARLGVTPQNVYLYLQGHNLFDNVVGGVIEPVATVLRREREKDIKRLAGRNTTQMDNEMTCYMRSQQPVVAMMRRNTMFKDSPQYRQICQHVERVLALSSSASTQQDDCKVAEMKDTNNG